MGSMVLSMLAILPKGFEKRDPFDGDAISNGKVLSASLVKLLGHNLGFTIAEGVYCWAEVITHIAGKPSPSYYNAQCATPFALSQ